MKEISWKVEYVIDDDWCSNECLMDFLSAKKEGERLKNLFHYDVHIVSNDERVVVDIEGNDLFMNEQEYYDWDVFLINENNELISHEITAIKSTIEQVWEYAKELCLKYKSNARFIRNDGEVYYIWYDDVKKDIIEEITEEKTYSCVFYYFDKKENDFKYFSELNDYTFENAYDIALGYSKYLMSDIRVDLDNDRRFFIIRDETAFSMKNQEEDIKQNTKHFKINCLPNKGGVILEELLYDEEYDSVETMQIAARESLEEIFNIIRKRCNGKQ